MALLLDTHVLLWWWSNDTKLSHNAREVLADSKTDIYVSAVSAWEIATKIRLGRLPAFEDTIWRFRELVQESAMQHLSITYLHGLHAGRYEQQHRDPFDRMLAAQAEIESFVLVTGDFAFQEFPVQVLW